MPEPLNGKHHLLPGSPASPELQINQTGKFAEQLPRNLASAALTNVKQNVRDSGTALGNAQDGSRPKSKQLNARHNGTDALHIESCQWLHVIVSLPRVKLMEVTIQGEKKRN